MDIGFSLLKLIGALVVPPASVILLLLAGLLLRRSLPRTSWAMLWLGTISLVVFSTPITSHWFSVLASDVRALDPKAIPQAQAIVILGGGTRQNAEEYGGDTLKWITLERVRYGAKLARETGLPVAVTGGVVFKGTPEADLMRDALEREFGVPVKWAESGSRNTRENASRTAALLEAEGIRTVLLVTHGLHMPRALAEFEAVGLQPIAAPTVPQREYEFDGVFDFVPNAGSLYGSYYAMHEIIGRVAANVGHALP
jgi:uncharacterized SAM-binding protein YcdF (DUF218 family)